MIPSDATLPSLSTLRYFETPWHEFVEAVEEIWVPGEQDFDMLNHHDCIHSAIIHKQQHHVTDKMNLEIHTTIMKHLAS